MWYVKLPGPPPTGILAGQMQAWPEQLCLHVAKSTRGGQPASGPSYESISRYVPSGALMACGLCASAATATSPVGV